MLLEQSLIQNDPGKDVMLYRKNFAEQILVSDETLKRIISSCNASAAFYSKYNIMLCLLKMFLLKKYLINFMVQLFHCLIV